MISNDVFRLTPKSVVCPLCGKAHPWIRDPLTDEAFSYTCNEVRVTISTFSSDTDQGIEIESTSLCNTIADYTYLDCQIPHTRIMYDEKEPAIKISYSIKTSAGAFTYRCNVCPHMCTCNFFKHLRSNTEPTSNGDCHSLPVEFKLIFDAKEFYDCVGYELKETHKRNQQKSLKQEETRMAKTKKSSQKTSIKTILWEKSPKENVEFLKTWAVKYKPVLKWAIPVATVYTAYRILNSNEFDLSVNNISETCEKKLGFKLEALDNHKALKELMVIGGLSAGAYTALKAVSHFIDSKEQTDITDIFVEEVEDSMERLDSVSKKFSWIQPKTEDMLPIAISVILVYVSLHKPTFSGKFSTKLRNLTEDVQIRLQTYGELAKMFIQEKFNLDLSQEEEQKKIKMCAFLVGLLGILAFLYGKKILGNKASSEENPEDDSEKINTSLESFIGQVKTIIKKLAPSVYTTLITLLISKKLLNSEDFPEYLEDEFDNEVQCSDTQQQEASSETNEEQLDASSEVDEEQPDAFSEPDGEQQNASSENQ